MYKVEDSHDNKTEQRSDRQERLFCSEFFEVSEASGEMKLE